jgi:hypothetical protein
MGAQLGRGAHHNLPRRAPWGRGDCLAVAGGLGRRAGERLGDVATTYGGDALPPRPSALGHSTRGLTGPEFPSAPFGVAAQGQR